METQGIRVGDLERVQPKGYPGPERILWDENINPRIRAE